MSCGGTSAPRRYVGVGGLAVRCAQSRGEWPGSRRTFLEGRVEGLRVEVERREEDGVVVVAVGGAREREEGGGGARRVDAVEGGGARRVEEGAPRGVGGGGGGGMVVLVSGLRFAVEVGFGRRGGGIVGFCGCGCGGGDVLGGFDFSSDVKSVAWLSFGLSPGAASFSLSPSSSVKVGTPGLSLGSSSSSSSSRVGDPAPLFTESCLPVHGERRADWYLYTMTETETSNIPSPNSTITMSPTSRCLIRCRIN